MGTNVDTLSSLLDLTKTLLDATTLDDAMQAVTDGALELLPGDHASLRVFDSTRTMLLCGARSGAGADDKPMEIREGEGIVGWVARHGSPALVHDATSDARFKVGEDQGFDVRSVLAVPLVADGQTLGVLGSTSPRTRAFAAKHEILAMLLANCAVPTIEKKRLERLAIVDAETMAFAASYLTVRLEEEIGRARRHELPLSVVRVRVEHLAPQGKEIRFLADTIRCALRRSDVLVRTGNGELTVILPHTGETAAAVVADRLAKTLEVTLLSDSIRLWPATVKATTWVDDEDAEPLVNRSAASLAEAASRQTDTSCDDDE